MSKKIGMIGLGKLGLPCLLAMEKHADAEIYGFDVSEDARSRIKNRKVNFFEEGAQEYLNESNLKLVSSVNEMVAICDIIFVAVQTPHEERFEGITPLGQERRDFNYDFLISAAESLAQGLSAAPEKNPHIVFISTVLPGTMRREIIPILQKQRGGLLRFSYNPYFIAMGSTIHDFLNPEFELVGSLDSTDAEELEAFYSSFIEGVRVEKMDIESAELAKVSYNTFIGFKILFANAIAEITDFTGGDPDIVMQALSKANKRLMSASYLTPGMGDGGGCHPRDQIAMSWLAQKSNMSFDIFEQIAKGRDLQTQRMAEICAEESRKRSLELCLLGTAYKPNTPLDVGSPVRLMQFFLKLMGQDSSEFDPYLDVGLDFDFNKDRIYFIGVRHEDFRSLNMITSNSVVIDPWNFVENVPEGVTVIEPGRRTKTGDLRLKGV